MTAPTFSPEAHPRSSTGTFSAKGQSAPELALAALELSSFAMYAADPAKVQVIESPVSDRERNYYITLADAGSVDVDIFMAGVQDDERYFGTDQERLWVGREGDELVIQYSGEPEDLSELVSHLSPEELSDLEGEIRAGVASIAPGVGVDFTDEEPWDSVRGLYTLQNQPGQTLEDDGRLTVTTSNIMGELEGDSVYVDVRNGAVDNVVRQAVRGRGLDG